MSRSDNRKKAELERTIEEALFDYEHTPDEKAKEKYHLIAATAAQDYYVVTGDWYHRKMRRTTKNE